MLAYGFGRKNKGLFEIDNTLEALQEFVGGYIEVLYIGNDLCLVCNEEGKLKGLEATAAFVDDKDEVKDIIVGDCFIVRDNGEGDFEGIREGDVEHIKKFVKEVATSRTGLMVIMK